MIRHRTLIIAVISVVLLGLIVASVVMIRGGALTPAAGPAADPTAASSSTQAATATPTQECVLSCGDSPQANMEAVPALVWDEPSKAAALKSAAAFMTSFARPELSAQDWYTQIYPLTDVSYGKALFGTNPARVTASAVTGEAVLSIDLDNGFAVWATVPTNTGPWSVQLRRTDAAAPWLAINAHPGEDHS
ncbi:hypothetical protein [Arthrobacter glacialis]|uniref:Uncharacterized protein n=1 Tax=Arthrobacter glacialis TaxID=1664 RepID=A0A2S3ZSJ1_ARTGL|nr:hypothetical protein [Arthrobacter glacialis]POH72198.1 hypothetical protein CVS27_17040 [Arthrobacter glacialis]